MFVDDLLIRYAIFIGATLILLRLIFFRVSPNREAYFSLFMFGNGVFIITYLLHSIEISMGFAFGLFAVFSMLRYRTETLTLREMTYLFITIVLALMCAVAKISFFELTAITVVIVVLAAMAETQTFASTIVERKIAYDRIDKIHPEHRQELIAELRERTGVSIVKIEVGKIDFLIGSVSLTLFCSD
ncbi:DUF4956 domain-containing protein [Teredinibacter franksiae]|jgi:hypothetical protein|uniref:DUF4956 domain-containing protein n=1 Tax=Teredinibacter franksiae TaxID=2761453 RepID=UPI001624BC8F|nr:DUF4956 domain-containing protein [Teredinibacter franksiae]